MLIILFDALTIVAFAQLRCALKRKEKEKRRDMIWHIDVIVKVAKVVSLPNLI